MATKNKTAHATNTQPTEAGGLLNKLDAFILKHYSLFEKVFTALSAILALAMFQGKISIGNDDALYVVSAYKMGLDPINNPYTETAPLYVMFLAVLTKIFGLKMLPMKLFSVLFFVLSIPVLFRAFKGKVSPSIIVFGIAALISNWMMLEYASYTYTETFYLLLYALLFWAYSKHLDLENEVFDWKKHAKSVSVLAVLSLLIILARNVGSVIPILMLGLFLIRKNWKDAGLYLASFGVLYLIQTIIFKAIWPNLNQYSTQSSKIFLKDNYDASKGTEDFAGMMDRFFVNTRFYTERFLETLGFIDPYTKIQPDEYGFPALVLSSLLVGALIFAVLKKDRMMQMVAGFVLILLGATFISLQISWAQHRLITIYVPLIIMACLYVLYSLTQKKSIDFMQAFVVLLVFIVIGSGTISSVKRISTNIPIAIKNLQGDKYEGYTQDWENFLKASVWCAENLPADAVIASRKEPMSFIYANGRAFYPIYKVPKDSLTGGNFTDADQFVEWFQNAPYRKNVNTIEKLRVEYFILAQLRLDLKRKISGQFVNTIHNCLIPIEEKYPGALELIHTEGTDEVTQVVKLNYDYIDQVRLARQQQQQLNK